MSTQLQATGYANFDLVIEKNDSGFRASAKGDYGGEAQGDFNSPFSATDFEALADRLDRSRAARTRRIETPQLSLAKEMGGRLHAAVLSADIRTALTRTMDSAERDGLNGVRIRLHLTSAPELAVLPWEFLFDADPRVGRFLALADESPLVRYLDLPSPSRPLTVETPLRLLAVVSNPADDRYPELDVEREWGLLQEALAQPIQDGVLKLDRLPKATMASLDDALQSTDANILHFIGHGRFDEDHQDGVLAFEGERGGAHEVSAETLGTLLYNEKSLRLVVINACEGGRASATDPYAGMAQTLVRMRIPAVVAMQYEITDRAAILFARQFYRGLAAGRPVDAAITDARLAVFSQVSEVEWATPVLYMRAPDGRIFDIVKPAGAPASAAASQPLRVPEPAPLAPAAASVTAPAPETPVVVRSAPAASAPAMPSAASAMGAPSLADRPATAPPPPVAPTTAAVSTAVVPADFGPRAIAFLIDDFIVALGVVLLYVVVLGSVEALEYSAPGQEFIWAALGAYFAFFWSTGGGGRTIGMRALGLRVVRTDGSPVDFGRAVIRFIGLFVSIAALGLGLLWAAFDKKKRGWHDMLADTTVVRDS